VWFVNLLTQVAYTRRVEAAVARGEGECHDPGDLAVRVRRGGARTGIQQRSLWLSEGQDNEAGDEAGLQETVRFVHDVASRITGTVESVSDASG
jgi:hypothetical protein